MYYEINEVEVQLNKSEVTSFMTRGQTLKKIPSNFSQIIIFPSITGFENHPKSRIQHCEQSLHFKWTKVNEKSQKWSILNSEF